MDEACRISEYFMLLIGIVLGVFTVLGLAVYLIGRAIGWDKIEQRNSHYVDKDGYHSYYDRHIGKG